jgi:hypothetical protein
VYSSYSKFIIYINYHPYFIIFLTNNFFLILISTTIHYFILIYIIIIFYFSLCNNNKQNKIRESEFLKINKIIPFYFLFSFSLPYFLSFLFFSSFLSLPIASPSTRLSLSRSEAGGGTGLTTAVRGGSSARCSGRDSSGVASAACGARRREAPFVAQEVERWRAASWRQSKADSGTSSRRRWGASSFIVMARKELVVAQAQHSGSEKSSTIAEFL